MIWICHPSLLTVKRNQFGLLSTAILTSLTSLNCDGNVVSFGCKALFLVRLKQCNSLILNKLERVA